MTDRNEEKDISSVLERRIHEAGVCQSRARAQAPEKRPRNWDEIEAYAQWIAAIRVREELLSLQREVC